MRPSTVAASCVMLFCGMISTGWSAPPNLEEALTYDGKWTANRGKLQSWELHFMKDGTLVATSQGTLSFRDRFQAKKTVEWEQTTTGTWKLASGGSRSNPELTLTLTVDKVQTKFNSPLPTSKELLEAQSTLFGPQPELTNDFQGKTVFSFNPFTSKSINKLSFDLDNKLSKNPLFTNVIDRGAAFVSGRISHSLIITHD